jgi:thiol:disulfide interchange protein DsbD
MWPRLCLCLSILASVALSTAALGAVEQTAGVSGGIQVEAEFLYARQGAGAQTVLEIRFSCPADYYVWQDPLRVAVEDSAAAGEGITVAQLLLPEPKEKYDETLGAVVKHYDGRFAIHALIDIAADVPPGTYGLVFRVRYNACSPGVCQPRRDPIAATLTVLDPAEAVPVDLAPQADAAGPVAVVPGDEIPTAGRTRSSAFTDVGPVLAVLVAYVLGLTLTLTPCVYPLIPVMISLVGATSGRGRLDAFVRSMIYVLGISITYSVVGVVAAATGGVFGAWLQHPVVYVALAVAFAALAGGMFGAYTIEVTSQRLQRLQARLRGKAGLVGILLIGLLSGAAATACIAPVVLGAMAYVTQSGNNAVGFLVFFAMAWGMGTPLVVVGTFTGLARSLPRAGAWMVTVKHAFGWALLATGVWFLGKARLLPDTVIRMALGGVLAAAALHIGVFSDRSGQPSWWTKLRMLAGACLLIAAAGVGLQLLVARPVNDDRDAIVWVESRREAQRLADERGSPMLLDFWADWCAPCHKMFRTTFRDPRVVQESKRFVMAKIDIDALSEEAIEEFRQAYGAVAAPMVVLVDSAGETLVLSGYIGPDAMLRHMQEVP